MSVDVKVEAVHPTLSPPLASPQLTAFLSEFQAAFRALRTEQERFHRLEWENFALRGRNADLEHENRVHSQDLFELRMRALRAESATDTGPARRPPKPSISRRTIVAQPPDGERRREDVQKALLQKRVDNLTQELQNVHCATEKERKRVETDHRELIERITEVESRLDKSFAAFFESRTQLAKAEERASAELFEARATIELLTRRLCEARETKQPEWPKPPAPTNTSGHVELITAQYRAAQEQWRQALARERERGDHLERRLKTSEEERKLRVAGLEVELARLREELSALNDESSVALPPRTATPKAASRGKQLPS